MKAVHIYKDDKMDEIAITSSSELNEFAKSQGEGTLQSLYTWKYEQNIIHCYGWYDGEYGFENKHELPPGGKSKFLTEDSSSQLLFGDIFIVKYDGKGSLTNIDIGDYGEFYHVSFGGFSDISDESCEDSEEEDVLKDTFLEESDVEEFEDDEYGEEKEEEKDEDMYEGELDEDTYEY